MNMKSVCVQAHPADFCLFLTDVSAHQQLDVCVDAVALRWGVGGAHTHTLKQAYTRPPGEKMVIFGDIGCTPWRCCLMF